MSATDTRHLAALAFLTLGVLSCRAPLRDNLDSEEAQRQTGILQNLGVDARPVLSGRNQGAAWRIDVPKEDLTRALRILSSLGVPGEPLPSTERIYDGKSLLPVPGEDRILRSAAIAGDVTRTLKAIPGVLDARVHLSPGKTASVLLRHMGSQSPILEHDVRLLVAGAAGDLASENVSVVFLGAPDLRPVSRAGCPSRGFLDLTRLAVIIPIGINMLLGIGLVLLGISYRRSKARQKKDA